MVSEVPEVSNIAAVNVNTKYAPFDMGLAGDNKLCSCFWEAVAMLNQRGQSSQNTWEPTGKLPRTQTSYMPAVLMFKRDSAPRLQVSGITGHQKVSRKPPLMQRPADTMMVPSARVVLKTGLHAHPSLVFSADNHRMRLRCTQRVSRAYCLHRSTPLQSRQGLESDMHFQRALAEPAA